MSVRISRRSNKPMKRRKSPQGARRIKEDYVVELPLGQLDIPPSYRFVGLDVGKIFQKDFLESIEAEISEPMMFILKVNCAGDDPMTDTLLMNILLVDKEPECMIMAAEDVPHEVVKALLEPLGGREAPMRPFEAIGFSGSYD